LSPFPCLPLLALYVFSSFNSPHFVFAFLVFFFNVLLVFVFLFLSLFWPPFPCHLLSFKLFDNSLTNPRSLDHQAPMRPTLEINPPLRCPLSACLSSEYSKQSLSLFVLLLFSFFPNCLSQYFHAQRLIGL